MVLRRTYYFRDFHTRLAGDQRRGRSGRVGMLRDMKKEAGNSTQAALDGKGCWSEKAWVGNKCLACRNGRTNSLPLPPRSRSGQVPSRPEVMSIMGNYYFRICWDRMQRTRGNSLAPYNSRLLTSYRKHLAAAADHTAEELNMRNFKTVIVECMAWCTHELKTESSHRCVPA